MARQGRIPDFLKDGVVSINENSRRAKGMGNGGGGGGGGGGGEGQIKLRHYINPGAHYGLLINPRTYNGGRGQWIPLRFS